MSKSIEPWLHAHGRLWYDDSWYRAAWIIWPQAIGILAFIVVWAHPGVPWGKRTQGVPDKPVEQMQKPAEQVDALAGCRTGQDYNQRVAVCSAAIASGKLRLGVLFPEAGGIGDAGLQSGDRAGADRSGFLQ